MNDAPDRHPLRRRRNWAIGLTCALVVIGVWGGATWLKSPPHIHVSTALYDFGPLGEKDKVEALVTVKNTGGHELEILRVTTSCGCTRANLDNQKLAPGKETALTIAFDASTHHSEEKLDPSIPEPVSHMVYLRSNDPTQPEVAVEIRAQIVHPKELR